MSRPPRLTAAVAFAVAIFLTREGSSAHAQAMAPLPPVDLGQTNILDGEGGPGALLEIITFGSGAGRLAGPDGRSAPGDNSQQILGAIIHPIVVSSAVWAGAHPGVEVLLPVTYVRNAFAEGGSGSDTGLGDLTIAPFLQWSGVHPGNGAVSARLGLQVVAPSGDHRASAAVNTGQGGWQLSPYLATTWRISTRWEFSARVIYDRSSSIKGPYSAGAPTRLQAGDLFVLNASASYATSSTLRLGVGGYLLNQLSASTAESVTVPDRLQRIYALGPVSRWQLGKSTILAAVYKEFDARNRPEGISANVRLQHPF